MPFKVPAVFMCGIEVVGHLNKDACQQIVVIMVMHWDCFKNYFRILQFRLIDLHSYEEVFPLRIEE